MTTTAPHHAVIDSDVLLAFPGAVQPAEVPPLVAFPFKWAIAHRDSRNRGPRPLKTWALYKNFGDWYGVVADDAETAPAELRQLLDELNALDGTAWTDFECVHVHIHQHSPNEETGDFSTNTPFMSRAYEARRHVGGLVCDDILAKEAPNLFKFLNDRLPPRKLLPAQQAELDRQAAAQAAAEQRAATEAKTDADQLELAANALLDAENKKLPATLRAANFALLGKLFSEYPRLWQLAESHQAFYDATGRDARKHADEYHEYTGDENKAAA